MNSASVPNLLLVNLGTPEAATPAAVRAFLQEFLADPAVVDLPRLLWLPILHGIVLRRRPERVAHQYASIWTTSGSPLRVATERITADADVLAAGRCRVSRAYRYGEPSIDAAIHRIASESSGPIVVVPLFPQRTDATTGTVFRRAREAAARAGAASRLVERVIPADDPGYIQALAHQWHDALSAAPHQPDHVVVSFHGLPIRYDKREGRMYTGDCALTTAAFLRAINWPRERTTLAFQSKFGPEPWLKPATADVLARLPGPDVRHVAVITPGFVTEGLETLEEIAIRGRETFVAAGGESLLYVRAVEHDPAFLQALVAMASG